MTLQYLSGFLGGFATFGLVHSVWPAQSPDDPLTGAMLGAAIVLSGVMLYIAEDIDD